MKAKVRNVPETCLGASCRVYSHVFVTSSRYCSSYTFGSLPRCFGNIVSKFREVDVVTSYRHAHVTQTARDVIILIKMLNFFVVQTCKRKLTGAMESVPCHISSEKKKNFIVEYLVCIYFCSGEYVCVTCTNYCTLKIYVE